MTKNNEIIDETKPEYRIYLVDIVPRDIPTSLLEDRMNELDSLVHTLGGVVILHKYQKKDTPDLATYIGKGKLEEIIADMERMDANVLLI